MSMRPQKPNDESSPSQTLSPQSFFSGFSLTTDFFNFSDHSQVLSLFSAYLTSVPLLCFFLEHFLKPAANPAALKFMLNF